MFKRVMRQLTPPIIWSVLARSKGQPAIPGVTIGAGTTVGKIEKRAPGGQISIGSQCMLEGLLVTDTDDSRLTIGDNVFVGGSTIISCAVAIHIEDDVLISYRCIINDSDSHSLAYSIRKNDLTAWRNGGQKDWSTPVSKPIHIGKGAWLGAQVIILKGVNIGEGAVVGAGSVVTNDVPAWTVVAGNPARVVKQISEHER